MPATPIYALPYPASTDPADVPADIKKLGDQVELAIAPGNAAGQAHLWDNTAKKWLAVPAVVYAEVETNEAMAGTSYADLATVGPSITIPSAGDWLLAYGASLAGVATIAYVWSVAPKFGAAAVADANAIFAAGVATAGATAGFSIARSKRFNGLSAGTVVKLQYQVAGNATSAAHRFLSATRVA